MLVGWKGIGVEFIVRAVEVKDKLSSSNRTVFSLMIMRRLSSPNRLASASRTDV